MKNINLVADLKEINRYEFIVKADSREEAEAKLQNYLSKNCPYPHQGEYEDDVLCIDRDAGWETGEVIKIKSL